MVVVLGSPTFPGERRPPGHRAGGLAARIALAAAAAGARVELVGKIGEDEAGDAITVDLERAGVGHAALLRDPSAGTPGSGQAAPLALERPDLELALRYLGDFAVIVAAEPLAAAIAEVVSEAAGYAGAHRVLVGGDADVGGTAALETADSDLTVLRAPARDEGAFADFVGRYAAYLDAGRAPADAFTGATGDVGWQPIRRA